MPGARVASKLMTALLALGLAGCLPLRRPVPAEDLPQRLVLALDGVDYRDVVAARERGRFADFHRPARLISTFPSISDIAWHAIFGVLPPAGYQRVYFSTRHQAVIGDALSAIRPIEYEARMDHAFDAKFHHLGAYLMSWPVARREVETDVQLVLSTRGRHTVYLYNIGPDALQHTRGDVALYLDHLDRKLHDLQRRYRERTGRALEIVVLSDHGHNGARDATFVQITEALAAHGFVTARALQAPNQVAFSVDGVTTGFGVFTMADSVTRVASLLATVPGVELVTARTGPQHIDVRGGTTLEEDTSATTHAIITWRHDAPDASGRWYRYRPLTGDPLRLRPLLDSLRATGQLDADGFAPESVWVRRTSAHEYPASLPRIVHGHLHAARNPAPILVSLHDTHRVGLGMVSVANRMRPLGGTHGALGATNALGVILSNTVVPHDDVAWHVREQFGGFDDLRDITPRAATVQIIGSEQLRHDRFAQRQWPQWAKVPDSTALAMLTLSPEDARWAGDSAWVRFEVRTQDGTGGAGRSVMSTVVPIGSGWRITSGRQRAWRAHEVGLTNLAPGSSMAVRLHLERRTIVGRDTLLARRRTIFTAPVRVASDGIPWSF